AIWLRMATMSSSALSKSRMPASQLYTAKYIQLQMCRICGPPPDCQARASTRRMGTPSRPAPGRKITGGEFGSPSGLCVLGGFRLAREAHRATFYRPPRRGPCACGRTSAGAMVVPSKDLRHLPAVPASQGALERGLTSDQDTRRDVGDPAQFVPTC